jgi:galactokinase
MDLIKQFQSIFQCAPELLSKAPGRVNLIGEHTDYNDGFVLPIAIENVVTILAAHRSDHEIHLFSVNFEEKTTFPISEPIDHDTEHPWSNYERGVIDQFLKQGRQLNGANFLIHGDVPIASGLSSSAAIEMATAMAFKNLKQINISDLNLIQLCQTAENEFVGMKCGIMDQFISCMGKAGHALFLDCRSLHYRLVPFPSNEVSVVILNTKVKRELSGSEYNERRSRCEEAVKLLKKSLPDISALRDVSIAQFERFKGQLPEIIRKRSEHVVYENERVCQFVEAMKQKDMNQMGTLLLQSHESLRNLYEVSCSELDTMVEIAMGVDGVIGARMTGAGFGGCAIAMVQKGHEEVLKDTICQQYPQKTSIQPEVYISSPAEGATVHRF